MAHFRWRVWKRDPFRTFADWTHVQSAKVQHGSRFHRQKVGVTQTEPYWAVLVSQHSSVGVPASWSYTLRPLSGRQNHICAITNKHSTRKVLLENGESLVHWRKCPTKVCRPSWTLHWCSPFVFFLGFISRLQMCQAAMRSRCLRSCHGYRHPAWTPRYHKGTVGLNPALP